MSKLSYNVLPTRSHTTCPVVQEKRHQAAEARAAVKAKHQQVRTNPTMAVTKRPHSLWP
jgi:hypothetical protein